MRKRKRKINHKKSIYFKILFTVCVVLLLSILFLSLNEFYPGIFEGKAVEKFEVLDECSLVMGNIIHQIKNDADCKIRCRGECDVRIMDFEDHNFSLGNNSCHSCDCFCK